MHSFGNIYISLYTWQSNLVISCRTRSLVSLGKLPCILIWEGLLPLTTLRGKNISSWNISVVPCFAVWAWINLDCLRHAGKGSLANTAQVERLRANCYGRVGKRISLGCNAELTPKKGITAPKSSYIYINIYFLKKGASSVCYNKNWTFF